MNQDGHRAVATYKDSGVDVAAGEVAVERIGPLVASTFSSAVLGGLGGFGSQYLADFSSLSEPVLVSSTDGVGTKTQVARALGDFSTLGFDLVAMCVDDLACLGAKPLFFLDYLAVGKQTPALVEEVVGGIARACKMAGCSLIGGETAEHPGVMNEDDLDLAGFVVGVAERHRMWGPQRVQIGDALVGISSPNLRSNGFSLVRSIYPELFHRVPGDLTSTQVSLLQRLGEPSLVYSPSLEIVGSRHEIHAAAHITGGGILSNLGRVIPPGALASLRNDSWDVPAIFLEIETAGAIERAEMFGTFNMGVGMILVLPHKEVDGVRDELAELGHQSFLMGEVVKGVHGGEGEAQWS